MTNTNQMQIVPLLEVGQCHRNTLAKAGGDDGLSSRLKLLYGNVGITFPLAVDTAAVLLAVKIKSFGHMAAIRVAFSQVGI